MKLTTPNFFVENNVVTASEQGVVYDLPRDRIQEVWDKLALYYAEKSKSDYKSEILTEDFYRLLGQAKAENETALETFELVNRGVLGCYEATEAKEQRFNIKRVVISEVLKIIRARLKELHDNIERERVTYNKLKNVDGSIRIVNGELRIYTGPFSFVPADQVLSREKCTGLHCTVKYSSMCYEGYFGYPPEKLLSVDLSAFKGTFRSGNVEITIKNEFSESAHQVCTEVIKMLLDGKKMKSILQQVPVFLSQFHVEEMTRDSQTRHVVEVGADKLADNRTGVFYVLTGDSVIKVMRSSDSFAIFQNGTKKYG